MDAPPAKKARVSAKSWKLAVPEIGQGGQAFGLKQLFAHGFDLRGENGGQGGAGAASRWSNTGGGGANRFYTLRLEHREGGPLAKFRGEERFLLFRSDRPGAIAKIIYSSEVPEESNSEPSKHPPSLEEHEDVGHLVAHAKIHVLDVKSQYRGRDLGGLLFSEAITSLKSKYCNDDDDHGGGGAQAAPSIGPVKSYWKQHKQVCDVECVLDAEEDVTRHGKLIAFYEHLGCRVKPKAKVQYVNNNDSETYRKVPMQIDLHPPKPSSSSSTQERARMRRRKFSHLVSSKGSFLPVQLVGSMGKLYVRSPGTQDIMKLDWLVTDTPEGIQFRTTHGHLLLATPEGDVTVLSPGDQDNDEHSELDVDTDVLSKWTHFVPCNISDEDVNERGSSQRSDSSRSLWVFRTAHGTFLTADSLRQTLSCTRLPSFWQANGSNLSLACTSDTPPRRQHYKKNWKIQNYDYVLSMRSRFLNFSLGKATLIEALGWIHTFPAHPFHVWSSDESAPESSSDSAPSLRTLSFLMAETAREEGLPDWVQLVALFHELGEAVKILDPSTGKMAESVYDWTLSSRSRVVGCKIPQRATFSEFRHLNTDEDDSRFNSETGVYQANCGLEKVLLMWSGSEYVYHLLRHNNASLPDEAFAMLRYFLLGDWHEHHDYSSLTSIDDEDMLPFVHEFDALRRRVRLRCVDCGNLTDEQCNFLWDSYYANIAAKYHCDHKFDW